MTIKTIIIKRRIPRGKEKEEVKRRKRCLFF